MKNYRIAIIGLGGMGGHHAEAVRAEENCELVGGAEIDAERGKAWGERFGVTAVYEEYERLLDEVAPDIALISTQAPQHHGPTIAAAQRGIHVFCEKPPGRSMEDILQVISCEKVHPSLKLMYGFNHRYHESVQDSLKLIRAGELGRIINLRGVYGKSKISTFNQTDWRTKREIAGGGVLLDQGIHLVDLMRLFG